MRGNVHSYVQLIGSCFSTADLDIYIMLISDERTGNTHQAAGNKTQIKRF